jgi:hypothetical protein
MGYRSEVKILAGKNPAKELHEINEKYHIFDSETPGKGGITLFTCDWVKWYEDDDMFPEVDAVMEVIDKYEDIHTGTREDGIDYYRIGEDSEDIDHRSNYTLTASLEVGINIVGFTTEE